VAALALILNSHYGHLLWGAQQAGVIAEASAGSGDSPQPVALTPAEENRYRALSEFVANRYRVSQTVAFDLVELAHRVGQELQLDPLLIIAVISIESRFNPIAESGMGAKGLMQIIPRFHLDKLRAAGGEDAVFDPESNILVGARILQEYVYRTGTLVAGLQQYTGAARDANAYYAQRVMAERERLEQVVRSRGLVTAAVGS